MPKDYEDPYPSMNEPDVYHTIRIHEEFKVCPPNDLGTKGIHAGWAPEIPYVVRSDQNVSELKPFLSGLPADREGLWGVALPYPFVHPATNF